MTFNKIKTYAIGVLFAFVLVLLWQLDKMTDKRNYEHSENDRHLANEVQYFGERRQFETYKLRQKELSDSMKSVIERQAKELKIKPKQIEKIVERVSVLHDTISKIVPVSLIEKSTWEIKDSTKCWFWKGTAKFVGDSLIVTRTDFRSKNTERETYYRQRPKKFLFFRFGKWTNYVQSKSDCDSTFTRTFEFIK